MATLPLLFLKTIAMIHQPVLTFHILNVTGNKRIAEFEIYPNPFEDHTMFSFPNPENAMYTLTLHDVLGKAVRTIPVEGKDHIVIYKNNLPAGLYLLQLEEKGSIIRSGKNHNQKLKTS